MPFCRYVLTAVLAIAMVLPAAGVRADPIVTKPIDKPFLITNWNYIFKIKSIETVTAQDKRPFLAKMNDCDKGYVIMVASVQNNNKSGSAWIPGATFSFELADGSILEGPKGDGVFIAPGAVRPPPSLFATEHRDLAFISCQWNGQPLTKLVFANRFRFSIPQGFVKNTVIGPAASPSP